MISTRPIVVMAQTVVNFVSAISVVVVVVGAFVLLILSKK